jgi:hypothetical protein
MIGWQINGCSSPISLAISSSIFLSSSVIAPVIVEWANRTIADWWWIGLTQVPIALLVE